MLTDLQNCQNLSDTKLVPTSDIILQGYHTWQILFLPSLWGHLLKGPLFFWWLESTVVIYNTQVMFIFEVNYICTNNFPWPAWYVMMSYLFFWLCLLEFKTSSTKFYIWFNISVYILPEHRFMGKQFVFSMPMWFMCSCASTYCFRLSGMIMHLPLSITPSITTSLSLYGQYGLMLVCSSSLVCGQPAIINVFSCWRSTSCDNACCSSLWIHIPACLLSSGWHPLLCLYLL